MRKTHLKLKHDLQWTDTVRIPICLILSVGICPCPGPGPPEASICWPTEERTNAIQQICALHDAPRCNLCILTSPPRTPLLRMGCRGDVRSHLEMKSKVRDHPALASAPATGRERSNTVCTATSRGHRSRHGAVGRLEVTAGQVNAASSGSIPTLKICQHTTNFHGNTQRKEETNGWRHCEAPEAGDVSDSKSLTNRMGPQPPPLQTKPKGFLGGHLNIRSFF